MCTMRAIACCAAALLLPASSAGLSTKVALWRVSETAQQAPVTTQLRREIALVQATRLRGGTTRPPKLSRSHEMYGSRSSGALALEPAGFRQQAEPLAASYQLLEDGTSRPSDCEQGLVGKMGPVGQAIASKDLFNSANTRLNPDAGLAT